MDSKRLELTILELQRKLTNIRTTTLKAVREGNFMLQAKLDTEAALINSRIREIREIREEPRLKAIMRNIIKNKGTFVV